MTVQPILGISIHSANSDFCEPGTDILRPGSLQNKKEYNTMEAHMIVTNDHTLLIKLQEYPILETI